MTQKKIQAVQLDLTGSDQSVNSVTISQATGSDGLVFANGSVIKIPGTTDATIPYVQSSVTNGTSSLKIRGNGTGPAEAVVFSTSDLVNNSGLTMFANSTAAGLFNFHNGSGPSTSIFITNGPAGGSSFEILPNGNTNVSFTLNLTGGLTLGSSAGTSGQVLTSAGSGSTPTWTTISGGSVAGSDTQIQYNNAGAFGGSSGFTWTNSSSTLGLASGATINAAGALTLVTNGTYTHTPTTLSAATGYSVNINSGGTASTFNGGLLGLQSGAASGTGNGGGLSLKAGNQTGTGAGNGGNVTLQGGNKTGTGSSGVSGTVTIQGGAVTGTGSTATGGATTISGGNVSATVGSGGGGAITIKGGDSTGTATGPGGSVFIQSGSATSGVAGDVNIIASTGGTVGRITLAVGGAGSPKYSIGVNGALVIGSGTTNYGTTGQVLTSQGSASPIWSNDFIANSLVVPKTISTGIKVDTAAPTFGWRDIIGSLEVKSSGATAAPFNTFIGSIGAFQCDTTGAPGSARTFYLVYHLPHDYVSGTDIFWHVHWAHNSASVTSGSVTWSYAASYAKGFDQAPFSTQVTGTVVQTASTVQYEHMVAEGQLSTSGGSGSMLNTDNLEVDGLIILAFSCSANSISAATNPFVFTADIHYQSSNIATKNKAPNFYA